MEKYKVLIIEDDEGARKQLAKVIRKEGFEVLTAESGEKGFDIFKKELPEVVIIDLKMPDIDGMEVVHGVKRLSPNVQVILVTAYGETDTAIMALREGALDYLKKPIELDQLTLALGRAREKIDEHKKAPPFPNLILAEDEGKTRKCLARALEKEGWEVFQAADGQEAIDIFKQRKIDIALLDIKMPKKDGLVTLHEMRGITEDFEAIILTGYGDESSAIQAMRAGAVNFIKKPIDLEELISVVKDAIAKLNVIRSFRFRAREFELSGGIITTTALLNLLEDMEETKVELEKAKGYTDNIIKSMIDTLIVVDPEGRIKTINWAVVKLLGYTEDELIGKPVATIFAEEEISIFKGTRLKKLIKEGTVRDYDMKYQTREREVIPVSFSGAVMRDKEGELVGIVGIARDMREIKRLMQKEKELTAAAAATDRKRAEEWQNTFDSISDLIFIQNKDSIITRANKAFARMLKVKPEDTIGKKCYELFHKSDKPWPNCPFEMTKKDMKPHTQEVNDPNIGFPLLVSVSPIFNDKGELIGAVHVAKDISEMKEAQEELGKKMHDLEVFHKITMGREFRIAELKDENARLKKELGGEGVNKLFRF